MIRLIAERLAEQIGVAAVYIVQHLAQFAIPKRESDYPPREAGAIEVALDQCESRAFE